MSADFLDCVRNGDWASASSLVKSGQVACSLNTPSSSVFVWLIELDAPTQLIIELVRHCAQTERIDVDRLGLLESCLYESSTKANAFETFSSLLAIGLNPNIIIDGGSTLLQKAMELNKVREVKELLQHGVDPNQMSIFGRESTSNIEEAASFGNAAGNLVLEKFGLSK